MAGYPARAQQPDRLPGRHGHEDRDQRREPGLAEGKHDQQRRNEDRRAQRPAAQASAGAYRPNRRWRLAYSTSAASKASGPKSGQRIGLK